MWNKIGKFAVTVTMVLATTLGGAMASNAYDSRTWMNDDCGPHFYLHVGSQGYSKAQSWQHGTYKHHMVNWGYLDYPYYKRSYSIPWWTTAALSTDASLRFLDQPLPVCYY